MATTYPGMLAAKKKVSENFLSAGPSLDFNPSTPTSSAAQNMVGQYAISTQQPRESSVDYRSILDSARSKLMQPSKTFNYNPDTDTSFQSAANAVRSGVGTAQANTNARLRAGGQGKSSYSDAVAQQIAQRAEEQIANQIRPQYEQQAYNRFQNDQNADRQSMNDLLTVGQGYNNLDQQGFTNAVAESGVTGRYFPKAVQDRINQVLDLKRQAEQPGVTADQMGQFRSQAESVRGQLAQLGVDPNVVGYENDYNQASQNAANFKGVPTMAAQTLQFNQDLNKQQQALNETQVMSQLTGKLPDGTPTNAAQQQQLLNLWKVAETAGTIPKELANLYELPEGMQTLQAKQIAAQLAISQQDANTSSFSAANSAGNASASQKLNREKFDFDKEQAKSKDTSKQVSQTSYSEFLQDLPRVSSADEGYALIQAYRQDGVDEATLATMSKAINSKFKE